MTQTGLRLDGVTKRFGNTVALQDVTIDLPHGGFSVLLGPSGCGKSTLLRMIAGLEAASAGTIHLDGRDITDRPPSQRDIAMVFQSYALFPHLTVAENIVFGLSVRRVAKAEQRQRLERTAAMMEMTPLLDRKPSQLSGGQQQRVALARAVISERPVCLMDEPLSNLDAKLRAEMRAEIRSLQERLGLTMVYVTHDQVEAMTMADRIVVLNGGRVEQIAPPRDLYATPATTFCARFIGMPPMNLIPVSDLPGVADIPSDGHVGIRPEDITLAGQGVRARVETMEYLGADQIVKVRIGETAALVRQPARRDPPQGDVWLTWPADALHLFDANGRRFEASKVTPLNRIHA